MGVLLTHRQLDAYGWRVQVYRLHARAGLAQTASSWCQVRSRRRSSSRPRVPLRSATTTQLGSSRVPCPRSRAGPSPATRALIYAPGRSARSWLAQNARRQRSATLRSLIVDGPVPFKQTVHGHRDRPAAAFVLGRVGLSSPSDRVLRTATTTSVHSLASGSRCSLMRGRHACFTSTERLRQLA